jgi:hypothetical protein
MQATKMGSFTSEEALKMGQEPEKERRTSFLYF